MSKQANNACTRLVGTRRVFGHLAWLGAGSAKLAFSHPAHQRVTPTVRKHVFFLKWVREQNGEG